MLLRQIQTWTLLGLVAWPAAGCRHDVPRGNHCLSSAPRWSRGEECTDLAPPEVTTARSLHRPNTAAATTLPRAPGSAASFGNTSASASPASRSGSADGSYVELRPTALVALRNMGAHVTEDETGEVTAIDLSGSHAADTDVSLLLAFPQLRELNLRDTLVSDAGLREVTLLAELEFLGLTGTLVTDAGLPALSHLRYLRFVTLGETIVSDEGLAALARCRRLEAMNLKGTSVTPNGVARLQRELPTCRIVTDQDARAAGREPAAAAAISRTAARTAAAERPAGERPPVSDISETRSIIPTPPVEPRPPRNNDARRGAIGPRSFPDSPPDIRRNRKQPVQLSQDPQPDDDGLADSRDVPPQPAAPRSDNTELAAILGNLMHGRSSLAELSRLQASPAQWEGARAVLQTAFERNAADDSLKFGLAVAEARCGRSAEAFAHFQECMGTAVAHYNVGVLLTEAGDVAAGRREFRLALAHDPTLTAATLWLAR